MDTDFLTVVQKIADRLTEKGMKLSIAESCTGGFISNAITNLPGASRFYDLSIVSYSISAKSSVLGLAASGLEKFGTVSEETAISMAKAVRKIARTDIALSITGVAGPETVENRDVGLIYMAVVLGDWVESKGMKLDGGREEIKRQASLEALNFLNRVLDIWL